ncbi:hypothetical protein LshimejAT787_0402290 [Lyophyllum shimeji]|uniref:Uncharacterized protein n=1 Tax=Lyophyllum shimeji TaxID=47721 RepID=A0A9P3UL08_LYOSH|nr:hypothetical protein LshimejAT787_0402290 [Lyophyllum shimeji]
MAADGSVPQRAPDSRLRPTILAGACLVGSRVAARRALSLCADSSKLSTTQADDGAPPGLFDATLMPGRRWAPSGAMHPMRPAGLCTAAECSAVSWGPRLLVPMLQSIISSIFGWLELPPAAPESFGSGTSFATSFVSPGGVFNVAFTLGGSTPRRHPSMPTTTSSDGLVTPPWRDFNADMRWHCPSLVAACPSGSGLVVDVVVRGSSGDPLATCLATDEFADSIPLRPPDGPPTRCEVSDPC